jgi:2-(1,2-epoxy-1,2-dihydrophenyl)acetyl-CoA isomerase
MPACRVEVDERSRVATLLLDRPDERNAFSAELGEALAAALTALERDGRVRAVVLAGTGAAFCVGGNLERFSAEVAAGRLVERVTADMGLFNPVVEQLAAFPRPVVAAIHGACAGGGLALAAACDLRVCSAATVFAPGFAGIGLPPDTGTSWLLPRLMGAGRAAEFLLRNRRLSPDEALAAGLVNEVVPDAMARACELAEELAAGPANALTDTKRLLFDCAHRSLAEQLAAEAVAVVRALHGDELSEGVGAFVAKRKPRFS